MYDNNRTDLERRVNEYLETHPNQDREHMKQGIHYIKPEKYREYLMNHHNWKWWIFRHHPRSDEPEDSKGIFLLLLSQGGNIPLVDRWAKTEKPLHPAHWYPDGQEVDSPFTCPRCKGRLIPLYGGGYRCLDCQAE